MIKTKSKLDKKFDEIPIEEDTRIISREQVKIGEYDAVHEKWFWDGIYGDSYIFLSEDVKDLSEEEILALANKVNATFKRLDRYTFVNFNFEVPY